MQGSNHQYVLIEEESINPYKGWKHITKQKIKPALRMTVLSSNSNNQQEKSISQNSYQVPQIYNTAASDALELPEHECSSN